MKKQTYLTDLEYGTDKVRLELEEYRSALASAFFFLTEKQKELILNRHNVSLIPELPIEVMQAFEEDHE